MQNLNLLPSRVVATISLAPVAAGLMLSLAACHVVVEEHDDIRATQAEPSERLPSTPAEPTPNEPVTPPTPCGANEARACDGGERCSASADCATGVCTAAGRCLYAKTCNIEHGGRTCGPDGQGEDCCTRIPMRDGTKKFALDKYNITAGRMRAFIEATGGDVRGALQANPPKWWDARWTPYLPAGFDGNYNVWDQLGPAPLYQQVSQGSRTFGCYLTGGGARTYWVPAEVSQAYGDVPQAYSQADLDEKALNCVSALMVAALCAWDGGRLPTPRELDLAWGPAKYPWGASPAPYNPEYSPRGDRLRANHGNNYEYPEKIGDDVTAWVAPPGRFPKGNGPWGHADLVGNVWNFTSAVFRDGPYTPDPLGQWLEWSRGGAWEHGQFVPFENISISGEPGIYKRFRAPSMRKYWAGGGRCARDL